MVQAAASVQNQANALAWNMLQPVVEQAGAQVAAEHQRLAETAALEVRAHALATQKSEDRARAAEAEMEQLRAKLQEETRRLSELRLDHEVLGRQLEQQSNSSYRSAPAAAGSHAGSTKPPSAQRLVPPLDLGALRMDGQDLGVALAQAADYKTPSGSVDLLDLEAVPSQPPSELRAEQSPPSDSVRGIVSDFFSVAKKLGVPLGQALAPAEPLTAVAAVRTSTRSRTDTGAVPAASCFSEGGGGDDGNNGGAPRRQETKREEKGEKEDSSQKKQEASSRKKNKKKGDPPGDGGDGGGGGDGSSSSSSSSSSASSSDDARARRRLRRTLHAKKYKEAEEVKVPPLPNASQYRAWIITVLQNLVAAAGRPDEKGIAWGREVEDETKPPAYFAVSGRRFATIDRKFGAALSKVATGELGRKSTQLQDQAMQNDHRMIKGREVLRVIVRYYATGKNAEVMFSLNDLQKVTLRGDNIENFQNTWEMVLGRLPRQPDPDVLLYCYHQQVKGFRPISEDIAHYNRVDDDHPDHSYEFLVDSVNRYLERTRTEKVREALSKGLLLGANADGNKKQGGPPGAPGPKGAGKG
ncbi:MAG: hypothetical protein GY701_14740, partial [Sulfitobacter sp.]|nr:hypothetical protein [Sulfitobacter sp.]